MGSGICAMHYAGMAAMEVTPAIQYDAWLVAASIVIAVGGSGLALGMARGLKVQTIRRRLSKKIGAALLMGAAIAGMHYTGMAASSFSPSSVCTVPLRQVDNEWLGILLGFFAFLNFGLVMALSVFDRRMAAHAEHLRKLTDGVPGVIVEFVGGDVGLPRIAFASAGLQALVGVDPAHAQRDAAPVFDTIFDEDRATVLRSMQEAAQRRQTRWSQEFRVQRPDGSVAWTLIEAILQFGDRDVVWNGYWMDITARREIEANLQAAMVAADSANQAKEMFLVSMSHEMRTPINGLAGMIDVLSQSELNAQQVEATNVLRDSSSRLLTVVNNIIDYVDLTAGRVELVNSRTDVCALIESLCDSIVESQSEKAVGLRLFIDPALPAMLLVDAERLRHVMFNLIDNAVRFARAQGGPSWVVVRIEVTECVEQKVILMMHVADNGIGMDAQTVANLFTPFSQASIGTTRLHDGAGIGLSLCKQVVELMGGSIAARSVFGHGSSFSVRLPVAVGDGPALVDAPLLAGLRCLLLEFDKGPLDPSADLFAYLKHAGVSVQLAQGVSVAQRMLAAYEPGMLVCIDVGSSGAMVEALRESCRLHSDLDVRFLVCERVSRTALEVPAQAGSAKNFTYRRAGVVHRKAFLAAVALAGAADGTPGLDSQISEPVVPLPQQLLTDSASLETRRILYAEDNEINQKVTLRQLAQLGFATDVANNGQEALDMWRRGDYALVLTDLHMPVMDGYSLASAIRAAEADGRHVPIVALTANALHGEEARCLAVGMDAYMTKPARVSDMASMLSRWLPGDLARDGVDGTVAATGYDAIVEAVDIGVLKGLVGDDMQVIDELLGDFRNNIADCVGRMQAARNARKLEEMGAVAHRLKSSARSVGAIGLGESCQSIETLCDARDLEGALGAWAVFEAEVSRVDAYLAVPRQ